MRSILKSLMSLSVLLESIKLLIMILSHIISPYFHSSLPCRTFSQKVPFYIILCRFIQNLSLSLPQVYSLLVTLIHKLLQVPNHCIFVLMIELAPFTVNHEVISVYYCLNNLSQHFYSLIPGENKFQMANNHSSVEGVSIISNVSPERKTQ